VVPRLQGVGTVALVSLCRYESFVVFANVGMSGAALKGSAECASVHSHESFGWFGLWWDAVCYVEFGSEGRVTFGPSVSPLLAYLPFVEAA